jgi:hypothetical protein
MVHLFYAQHRKNTIPNSKKTKTKHKKQNKNQKNNPIPPNERAMVATEDIDAPLGRHINPNLLYPEG